MSVTQSDGAYFAIPLLLLLTGSATAAIPLLFIQNIVFFTIFVSCIEYFYPHSNSETIPSIIKFKKIFLKNPIIISSFSGFILSYLHIKIPSSALHFIHFFAQSASPVALFSLGLSFCISLPALLNWKAISKNEKYSLIIFTLGKSLLLPAAALAAGWAWGLSKEQLLPLVVVTACPAATHNYIVAHQYKLNESLQTNLTVLTTILSFFSIILFLNLLH